jgi:hypothetical protein
LKPFYKHDIWWNGWVFFNLWCRRGCERMVVGFTTTYAISAYQHWCCEFESIDVNRCPHHCNMTAGIYGHRSNLIIWYFGSFIVATIDWLVDIQCLSYRWFGICLFCRNLYTSLWPLWPHRFTFDTSPYIVRSTTMPLDINQHLRLTLGKTATETYQCRLITNACVLSSSVTHSWSPSDYSSLITVGQLTTIKIIVNFVILLIWGEKL